MSNYVEKSRNFEIAIRGDYALFTDPLTKLSGEKFSYSVPTYGALVGIIEAIYFKPVMIIVVDKIRIMNKIEMEPYGARPIHYSDSKNDLSIYTYLKNVYYQVQFHYEWNMNREDLSNDRNFKKHNNIFERAIKLGGRRNPFLGTSECIAKISSEKFGDTPSFYDNSGKIILGTMYHSLNYGDNSNGIQEVLLWHCVMNNGIIEFTRPENCKIRQRITDRGYMTGEAKDELDSRPIQTVR